MNLPTFRQHIKTVDHATLDTYHDEISTKLRRCRTPARSLGYALALDELAIESERRRQGDVPEGVAGMSDDELLAALEN